jgi:hypothetical protein
MQQERLSRYRWYLLDAVQLAAVAFAALALIPTGAHVFELASGLEMSPDAYRAVQHGQHGTVVFATLGCLATAAFSVHAFLVRSNASSHGWSVAALVVLAAAQAIFWSIAVPISFATDGWSFAPADFEAARWKWEFAFASAGVLTFGSLLAFVRAIEASRPIPSMAILKSIESDAAVRAARLRARPDAERQPAPLERALAGKPKAA